MTSFLPNFGNIALAIPAFVIALSIIVAIHEYGHYIVGRWSGIKADVFSLGFGKVLFSRVDKHGTQWQLAAIPLGGYVKFRGDANAASVNTSDVGGRDTMLGAPLWARSATVAAGPIFNFILTVVILTGLSLWSGKATDPLTLRTVPELPATYLQELEAGDQIIAVENMDARSVAQFAAALDDLPLEPSLTYTIVRDGEEMQVEGPYPQTTRVMSLTQNGAAREAGVLEGDVVTAINGQEVFAFSQLMELAGASDGEPQVLTLWRDGGVIDITVTPDRRDLPTADGFETRWLLGISGGIFFEPVTETPGLFEAIGNAFEGLWYIIDLSLTGMKYMILGEISTCNLSSPIGIAEASGQMAAAGALDFIQWIATLSAAIGLMNLFPIPVLDGGHLVFFAYEGITGKRPSDGAMRVLIVVGLGLILSLMLFGILNDAIFCR